MASRSLGDLRPVMQIKAENVLEYCRQRGVDLLIYCTLRGMAEQQELYDQGRTTPGRIVTYARPGQSAHNYGLAFDAVPLVNGKALWRNDAPQWQTYALACEDAGLEWAGTWKRFKEFPHAQLPNWKEVA